MYLYENFEERKMNSPKHTVDQTSVETMSFSGEIGIEEVQGGSISQ